MNFSIPENATSDEIEAIIERGMDAMMDAVENGGDPDVAFFPDGTGDPKINYENKGNGGPGQEDKHDDMVDEIEKMKNKDKEEDPVCPECGQAPCVFFEHEELLVEYDDAEYGLTTSVEPIPSNNIRRKKLYRQLTLMLNGGPLGAGVRKPLPTCCVSAIRDMLPSDTFMGYKSE
jgi:hypothetical protein